MCEKKMEKNIHESAALDKRSHPVMTLSISINDCTHIDLLLLLIVYHSSKSLHVLGVLLGYPKFKTRTTGF